MSEILKNEAIRNIASHFAMMLAGYELDCEANNEPVNMEAIVSWFMGNGASSSLSVRDVYEFLYATGYWSRDRDSRSPL